MKSMRRCCVVCFAAVAVATVAVDRALGQAWEPPPRELENKITLGEVSGRIDHLAIDLPRQRLFVAELGDDRVQVVDLKESRAQHVITGLNRPQGIGYVPSS